MTILVLGSLTVAIFTYVLRFVEVVVRDYLTEINAKANELSQSLQKLESTQAMMIEQEKFASLGSMVAGIAHEIQNPLNFVNNFSEVSNLEQSCIANKLKYPKVIFILYLLIS